MRKNSIKNIRINEEVMRELSDIIRNKVKDPRIAHVKYVKDVEGGSGVQPWKVGVRE